MLVLSVGSFVQTFAFTAAMYYLALFFQVRYFEHFPRLYSDQSGRL